MYQVEVKLELVKLCFNPANGWAVTVDVDSMERAKGGSHKPDKAERAAAAIADLKGLGVTIRPHKTFGRMDVVAEHPDHGTRLIEVEGESSRQREQAMYSALGQLLVSMELQGAQVRYGLAVPDSREWIRQLQKIPQTITAKLTLDLYAVGEDHVQVFEAGELIPDWGR